MRRIVTVLALAVLIVAGCGGDNATQRTPTVVLSLDFIPNAVHAPIYAAVRDGRDREQGIRLQIRKPAGGPDALKLVTAGRVDLGVLDIHDLAIARQQGADLVAIGALVGRPLAGTVAAGSIRTHRADAAIAAQWRRTSSHRPSGGIAAA